MNECMSRFVALINYFRYKKQVERAPTPVDPVAAQSDIVC